MVCPRLRNPTIQAFLLAFCSGQQDAIGNSEVRRWLAGISFALSLSFDTLAFRDDAIMVQVRLGF
jgi:hypothetical protein